MFSAGASFGAAAILGTVGIVIVTKTKHSSQLMFAAMPFLFGVQQLCEGFEWLSFTNSNYVYLRSPMMFAFLAFAQIVWRVGCRSPSGGWSLTNKEKNG